MRSLAEAARTFGVPLIVVIRAVRLGRLPAYRIGGVVMVRLDDLGPVLEAQGY